MTETITYRDFKKLDIRIGTVEKCQRVEGSDKLYRLLVDCGEPNPRQIISSLVDYYTCQELEGKRIAVLVNLKPAKIFGQTSNGMLLAAEEGDQCVLLTTDKPIPNGAQVT